MIKANELRIGNLIELPCFNGTGENIVADVNYGIFTCDANCIRDAVNYGDNWAARPITLTKEWLVKLGFEFKNSPREYGWIKNVLNRQLCWCHSNEVSIEFKSGQFDEYTNTLLDIKCEYVHQLQNIYHSLTGDELTII